MSKRVTAKPVICAVCPADEESVRDAALVEHFDGARGDSEGTRAGEFLIGPALDDGDVHSRQRQFAREHEPRRSAARDHDRMIGHCNSWH